VAAACSPACASPRRSFGVEPAGARRYACSLAAGRAVRLPPPDTIADGLRGQYPGERLLPIIRSRVDELIAVTDEQLRHAMDLLRRAGVVAEPSGSAALAGALQAGFTGRAAAVVSGGNGRHLVGDGAQAGRRDGKGTP
jgi:threonine dehydratase